MMKSTHLDMKHKQEVLRAAGLLVYRRVKNATIEYLLLQASYPPHHWTPPKGHLDPGEDERTAALRETQEEVGLTLTDLLMHDDFRYEMHYTVTKDSSTGGGGGNKAIARQKVVTYWLAKLKNGEADGVKISKEHQAYVWMPLEDAIKRAKFSEMEQLLRSADAYLMGQQ